MGVVFSHGTPVIGVTWSKGRTKWQAQIRHGGRRHNLGYFPEDEEEAAAEAYTPPSSTLRNNSLRFAVLTSSKDRTYLVH